VIVHKIGLTYKYVFVKKLYALNAEPLVFEPAGVQSGSRIHPGDRPLSRKRRHRGSWRDADSTLTKKIWPEIYRVPIFSRQYCKMLCEEIDNMRRVIGFEPNAGEDELRQIPEIVLKEQVPELYRNMWHVVQNVLAPIIFSLYQREVSEIASVQIANYNLRDKQQGAWHHDESADISVVIPLNTGDYKGGGTEFHNHGVLSPLPSGHALIFPSFTNLHRGLPVEEGDRYLLVFWLYDKKRAIHLYEEVVE
jgi:hypothetical protein